MKVGPLRPITILSGYGPVRWLTSRRPLVSQAIGSAPSFLRFKQSGSGLLSSWEAPVRPPRLNIT